MDPRLNVKHKTKKYLEKTAWKQIFRIQSPAKSFFFFLDLTKKV